MAAISPTIPPELLAEDVAIPSLPAPSLSQQSDASNGLTFNSASALQSSIIASDQDTDLEADLAASFGGIGLEDSAGVLPLSGVTKDPNIPDTLDEDCDVLMKELGIAPDNIHKLCGEGFYGPIRELKDKFQTGIDWYLDQLRKLDSEEDRLNAVAINPNTTAELRNRANEALSVVQQEKARVKDSYDALLPMNELVSEGVDAYAEIRKELLAALWVLRSRLMEGGLYGKQLEADTRQLIAETALDKELEEQVQPTAPVTLSHQLEQRIDKSVANILKEDPTIETKEKEKKEGKKMNPPVLTSIDDEEEEEDVTL